VVNEINIYQAYIYPANYYKKSWADKKVFIILSGNHLSLYPMKIKATLFVFILFLFSHVSAQHISTLAGTGIAGSGGDGGPATMATLQYPNTVLVDGSGNVFISETNNNDVRMVNTSGIIINIAGTGIAAYSGDGGPATLAALDNPSGLAMDVAGNLYVSDLYNHIIRKISPAIGGTITTIAGTPGIAGYSGDGGPETAAKFDQPYGLSFDTYGNLYVADQFNHAIRKIDAGTHIISTIAGNGTPGFSGDGVAATNAILSYPTCVFVDRHNNIFVSDNGNQRIRVINTVNIISTAAGSGATGWAGDGGPATSAGMSYPAGLCTDTSGNLYFCDAVDNRIRKVNTSGIINTICGTGTGGFSGDGGPATAANIDAPNGVAIDHSGNIVIADEYNNRIRIIGNNNTPPAFTGGTTRTLNVCTPETPTSIDSFLAITDPDAGQTEVWSLASPPSHGTVIASYTATATGGTIIPTGLTYSPAVGYSGTDMFQVSVTDGMATTTVTINVNVSLPPGAGVISGVDSVCPGSTAALSETVSGGIWSNSNTSVSDVSGSGIVTGIAPGIDTVIYTVINECGISSAIFPFMVRSYTACGTAVPVTGKAGAASLIIYPTPNTGKFSLNISSKSNTATLVTITDVVGNKVKELIATTNHPSEINLDVPAGIYFVMAFVEGCSYETKIIVFK
jgi:hypothetical protein